MSDAGKLLGCPIDPQLSACCVVAALQNALVEMRGRNHHAMDLARLSKTPLRTDCDRVDHAMEDILKALSRCVDGLEDVAAGDCEYGDGCPPFGLKHYRCLPCKAREALKEALNRDYCTDGSCPTCKAGEPCH